MKRITFTCIVLISVGIISSCKKSAVTPVTSTIDSLKVGLIAYYPFNNSGADSSGKYNDVNYYSNITSTSNRFGIVNSAFYFDGVSSYASVQDNQGLRLNNTNFTLSAWVKLDSYGSSFGYNILTKHTTGNDNGWAWGITGSGGTGGSGNVVFGPGGTSASARGTKIIALNQWHLMTSTYNVSNKVLSTYIDGTLDNTTTNIPSPNATISAALYIGRDNPAVSVNGYFFQGSLDEIRIYNRLLSTADIQKLYAYKN